MNRTHCFLTAIIVISIFSRVYAQLPSLSPSQTVNPATGEMGFSLPLGVVHGIGGHDFPVTLNYKAGIDYQQKSSPVGLGFSYDAGSITRKVVFVPDDNSRDNAYSEYTPRPDCSTPIWVYIVSVVCAFISFVVTILLAVFNPPLAPGGAFLISLSLGLMLSTTQLFISYVAFLPSDYRAGSQADPMWPGGNGRGFFEGGELQDLPDLYFINTPYINGQFTWIGDKATGHFVFTQTNGSAKKNNETVRIDYDSAKTETFIITLTDGTRLIFDKNDKVNNIAGIAGSRDAAGVKCNFSKYIQQDQSVPVVWHLTKVLFTDFVDGSNPKDDDPLNSLTANRGSWIRFEYDSIVDPHMFQYVLFQTEVSQEAVSTTWRGYNYNMPPSYPHDDIRQCYLKRILTPNERVEYNYSLTRQDDLWFTFVTPTGGLPADNSQRVAWILQNKIPVARPVLQNISLWSKAGKLLRDISFQQSYELRKKDVSNYVNVTYVDPNIHISDSLLYWYMPTAWETMPGNIEGASLTLNSILISASDGTALPLISFKYSSLNPDGYGFRGASQTAPPYNKPYSLEEKDFWGYYCPRDPGCNTGDYYFSGCGNDFNSIGQQDRATNLSTGQAYAEAWSLKGITLPNGATITWNYEASRYSKSNNQPVESNSSTHAPRYGGGIRVRDVSIADGNTLQTIRYFYTNTPNVFQETNLNSSGHATVEPLPYIDVANVYTDHRPTSAVGGPYVPCKVAYELVQTAVSNMPITTTAPNGSTAYEFITSKDFPNPGKLGNSDCSWKRGYLSTMAVHDKNGKMVDSTKNEYSFNWAGSISIPSVDIYSNYVDELMSIGWARPTKVIHISDGVRSEKKMFYADRFPGSADHAEFVTSRVTCGASPDISDLTISPTSNRCAQGYFIGDQSKPDMAIVQQIITTLNYSPPNPNPNTNTIKIYVIKDYDPNSGNFNSCSNSKSITIDGPDYQLIGAQMGNVDQGTTKNDLILVLTNSSNLRFEILRNIDVDNANNNIISQNSNPIEKDHGWQAMGIANVAPFETAISDISGAGKTDLLLFSLLIGDHRMVFSYLVEAIDQDGNYSRVDPCQPVVDPLLDNGNFLFDIGSHCYFTDYTGGGNANDLIFSDDKMVNSRVYANSLGGVFTNEPQVKVIRNFSVNSSHQLSFGTISVLPRKFCTMDLNTRSAYIGAIPCEGSFSNIIHLYAATNHTTQIPRMAFAICKDTMILGDFDGQPNQIVETNSDGKMRLTITKPAFFDPAYSPMAVKHMLSQTCQTSVYNLPSTTPPSQIPINPTYFKNNVVSAEATTWSNQRGTDNSVWVPYTRDAWHVNMDQSIHDLPNQVVDFADFVHTSGAANSNWKPIDTIEEYNGDALPLQTKDAIGRFNCTIYRDDISIPVAVVTGARYSECLFSNFSVNGLQDTNINEGCASFDSVTYPHFSYKTVKVSAVTGAVDPWTRTCFNGEAAAYLGEREITWEFWAKADQNNTKSISVLESPEMWELSGHKTVWIKYDTFTVNTIWKKFSFKGVVPTGVTRYRISMRPPFDASTWSFIGSGTIWYDDVRAFPTGTLMTTKYYDKKWNQPMLTVDPNNNPSEKVSYDDFGRPVIWQKFDPANHANIITMKTQNYFFKYQGINLSSPQSGSINLAEEPITIKWSCPTATQSVLLRSSLDGSNYTDIATVNRADASWGNYIWTKDISFIGTNCRIRVLDGINQISAGNIFTVKNALYYTNMNDAGANHFSGTTFSSSEGNFQSGCDLAFDGIPSWLPSITGSTVQFRKIMVTGFVKNAGSASTRFVDILYTVDGSHSQTLAKTFIISGSEWTKFGCTIDLSLINLDIPFSLPFNLGIRARGGDVYVDDIAIYDY